MLQRWKRDLVEHAPAAFPGHGRVSPAQAARDRVQADNTRVRMERDMLTKALGVCASASREARPVSASTRPPGRGRSCVRGGPSGAAGCRCLPISTPSPGVIEPRWPCGHGEKRCRGRRGSVMGVAAWPHHCQPTAVRWCGQAVAAGRRPGGTAAPPAWTGHPRQSAWRAGGAAPLRAAV